MTAKIGIPWRPDLPATKVSRLARKFLAPSSAGGHFKFVKDSSDLARLLNLDHEGLKTLIDTADLSGYYETFSLRKRSGGVRLLEAPQGHLRLVQKRLQRFLQEDYRPSVCATAYISERGIVDNARRHAEKKWVFNVDLSSFFHSISASNIEVVLGAKPYYCGPPIARAIAHLATVNNRLPMGAPTSPVLSNIVAWELDATLVKLAKRYGAYVTRYSDDITFSTNRSEFPTELGSIAADGKSQVGEALESAVIGHGFALNSKKTWLMARGGQQRVTGLIVNDGVNVPRKYIRAVRAMLHDWDVHGYSAAETRLQTEFSNPHRSIDTRKLDRVLAGKIAFIEHVRGADDSLVLGLWEEFDRLRRKTYPTSYRFRETSADEDHVTKDPISILHLSDFHFSQTTNWDAEPMLQRLVGGLEGKRFDLCVVTGDVAYSGQTEEYALARRFFDSHLLPATGLEPRNLFFVAGNHDVDWSAIPFSTKKFRHQLDDDSVIDFINDVLDNPVHAQSVLAPLKSYMEFAQHYGDGGESGFPWFLSNREVRGSSVAVAGLCSPLLSFGEGDHGQLIIGLPVANSLFSSRGADIRISAMHHPESWLHESESSSQTEIERWSDIILHGHLHRRRTEAVAADRDAFRRIAAGACYQGSKCRGSFNVVEIEPTTKSVSVAECRWDEVSRSWEAM